MSRKSSLVDTTKALELQTRPSPPGGPLNGRPPLSPQYGTPCGNTPANTPESSSNGARQGMAWAADPAPAPKGDDHV